ncbi:BTAD domain-containing putative transcriptional regulator [Actinokineospora sp. HUAS TT18]|uniref:BTAD domain-containing putative transcriptional regulator n=1 Tax=Actinokineospora sp. HUAS TT18 TaxID=3447451 RepID=UPI003F5236B2
MTSGLRLSILGPLAATDDGQRLDLGGPKQRELVAMLVLHLDKVVTAGRLIEALWGSRPPASAEITLRTHVSHLRKRLGRAGAALVTERPGYRLRLDPEQVDAWRFERIAGLGQESLGLGDARRAAGLLREALGLWRGPVLEDLGYPEFAAAESARLDEARLVALEGRIEADLALGGHQDVVAELEALVADHPYRERLRGQLMLALYRSGRQVDALAVHAAARRRLADELGLDPGPALAELETAILRHDPALRGNHAVRQAGAPAAAPPDAIFSVARRVRMVGRAAELDRLLDQWRAVRDGDRRVVVVSGEAGVGKTRLVAEFAHRVAQDPAVVLIGRCDHAGAVPYQPVADAFRSSVDATGVLAAAPDAVRDRLAALLDLPAESPAEDRQAVFGAVGWLLARLAAMAPVVLVVEEAERVDRASALLLGHLVRHLPAKVLVAVCFRDPSGGRHAPLLELLAEVEGRGVADRLDLRPLSEVDMGALVAELTGAAPGAEFVRRLWHNTGGNPLYATEVVRDLDARGELGGHAWPVPSGVRDILRHRLRGLPRHTQDVVGQAAVIGREVEFGLLLRLSDEPEERLIDSVEDAVGAGFLVVSGSSWTVSYAFPHDLMRDAVYADLPVPRRQRLHLRAATALLESGRAGDVVTAAVHLRAAGPAADPARAAEVSLQAADEARRLYAWDEAIAHAEAAVALLADGPADRLAAAEVRAAMLRIKSSIGYPKAVRLLESALGHAQDEATVASVHGRIGGALSTHHSVMDIPRAIEHFTAARRLRDDHDFQVLRGLAQAAMYGLRTDLLGTASADAVALAGDLGRLDLGVLASWGRAWFAFNRGEPAEAAAVLERMWADAHALGDAYLGWASVNAAALCATEYLLDPGAARVWCRRGLTQARFDRFGHPHDTVVDQVVLAMAAMGELPAARRAAEPLPADAVARRLLLFLDGDWERAEQAWATALAADESAGDRHDAALNARWLAGVRELLGDLDGAVAAWERALALGVDGPQVPTELAVRAELARVHAVEGETGTAADHLSRCAEILAGGQDWRGLLGTVELARGALAAARGQHAESDAAHENAVRVFTEYRLPWRRALALRAWARVADDPAQRLRAAVSVFAEIGAAARWVALVNGTSTDLQR